MTYIFMTILLSILSTEDFVSHHISLQEVEKLRQEKLEIDQQLRNLSVSQPGPYFPPPRERRYSYIVKFVHTF